MPNQLKKCLTCWKLIDDYYEVRVEKDLKDEKGVSQKGCCLEEDRLIQIDERVAESDNLDCVKTVLHEIIHPLINSLYHGEIDFETDANQEKLDKWIEFSTSCLIMLMIDNTEQFYEILNQIKRRKSKWQKSPKRKKRR